MSETRRSFLKAGTALASGVAGAASSLRAEGPAEQNATQAAAPGALVQVPKMKFGNAEISRLVLGTNQFYGFSHYSQNLDYAMRQWYTTDKICEVLRHASECGINTFNYVNLGRSNQDLQKFIDEGGKMNRWTRPSRTARWTPSRSGARRSATSARSSASARISPK
jgi:hypothetical protein